MADQCLAYINDPAWSFGDNILGVCSGHGDCVNGVCVCHPGWTGLSDWVNGDGFDCQINITAYKVTWGILLGMQVIAVGLSIPYLRARYDSYMEIKAAKQKKGERYSLKDNRGAAGMVLWYGLGAPAIIVMSVIKLFKDDERIGITYAVSVCYAIIRIVFYLCYVLFQPALLEAVMHGAKKTGPIITWNRRVSYLFFVMHFFAAFLPFVAIANPESQMAVYLASTLIMCLTGLWLAAQAIYVTKKLTKTLDQSYEMAKLEKTKRMKEKLQHMQAVPMRQAPIVGVIYAVMFVWPFLWNKHDYFLAISWIMFVLTGLRTAKTSLSASEAKSINSSGMSSSVGPQSGEGVPATSMGFRRENFDETQVDTTDSYV